MRAGLALTAVSLGFFLVQLDVSIVNVALASIDAGIAAGVTGLQWVVDAYTLAFASLLLSAGATGDRIGPRRTFIAGLLLFVIASLGCAMAPGIGWLIAARVLQGAGASALVPCSIALLNHAARDDAKVRTRAISLWTAAGSVGLALGPVLGGVLVSACGWRSVFFASTPFGLLGVWLACRFVEEAPTRAATADLPGQLLAILTLFCLTGAIIEAGPLGWSSPLVWGSLATAAVAGCGFIGIEQRAEWPMLPLGFFRNATFAAATCVGFLLNLALYGSLFVLGLYFQQVALWSPFRSGIALLPFAIAIFAGNIAVGRLATLAPPRLTMATGLLVAGFGAWLLRDIGPATPYAHILLGLVLLPFGIGLAVPLMTTSLLATVPKDRSGIASGVLNAVRQTGGAIGVAVFGMAMTGPALGAGPDFRAASIVLVGAAAIAAGFIGQRRFAIFPTPAR